MWRIPCRIVTQVPDSDPSPVEVEIVDAHGTRLRFRDKLATFRSDGGEGGESVRCTLLRLSRLDGTLAFRVSTEDRSEFEVRELCFSGGPASAAALEKIPHRPGWIDIDALQLDIACALGALPSGTTPEDAKPLFWTRSAVGYWTLAIITSLTKAGQLEESRDDNSLLRWVE